MDGWQSNEAGCGGGAGDSSGLHLVSCITGLVSRHVSTATAEDKLSGREFKQHQTPWPCGSSLGRALHRLLLGHWHTSFKK